MRPLSAPPTPTEQTQPETSGGRPHAPKRGAARSLSPRHPKGDLHAQGAIAESGDHCRTAKLLRVWLSDGGSAAGGRRSRLLRRLRLSPHGERPDSGLRRCGPRSEEHTSELQSLMRISYAVFCLNKKNTQPNILIHLLFITLTTYH